MPEKNINYGVLASVGAVILTHVLAHYGITYAVTSDEAMAFGALIGLGVAHVNDLLNKPKDKAR